MEVPTLFSNHPGADDRIREILEEISETVENGKYVVVMCTELTSHLFAIYLVWDREFGPHVCSGMQMPQGLRSYSDCVAAAHMAGQMLQIREGLSGADGTTIDVIIREFRR